MVEVSALQPDVAGAISTRVTDLMRKGRAARLSSKVDEEVGIDREAALLGIDIDLYR